VGIPILLAAAALAAGTGVLAGELEPPGPPAPTMKTLEEAEPRIPIYAEDLPLTITEPGSYYLAEDIETTGQGITIEAEDVTIDLMGHALRGGVGTAILATAKGVTVRDGTVRGWSSHGIYLEAESLVSRVSSIDNGGMGIRVGWGAAVLESFAHDNDNDGIHLVQGLVRSCRARLNEQNGIYAASSEMDSSLITDCLAHDNTWNGIRVDGPTTVRGNQCSHNGYNAGAIDKSGILVLGNGSRIEGNTLSLNDGYGIRVEGTSNTVYRNAAHGNGKDAYWIGPWNDVGPIGNAHTATSPWANINY
jgi:parallel beta-helix repeat protein